MKITPIDDLAMGSPLDPVLANFFMGYYEQKWLQSFGEWEVVLYRRYVDDICFVLNSECDGDKFYVFLNQQHSSIKFTIQKQIDKQLSIFEIYLLPIMEIFS